jgi:hypothetical protein
MPATRRKLLKVGALSGLAALVGSPLRAASGFFQAPADSGAEAWWMARSLLEPQVGTSFGVRRPRTASPGPRATAPRLVSLRLDEVAALTGLKDRDDCFSAQFSGPSRQRLAQGTYSFEHPAIGSFPAFLVPFGMPGPRQRYEVIVNRSPASTDAASGEVGAEPPAPRPNPRTPVRPAQGGDPQSAAAGRGRASRNR